jgi:aspartyl protease family protein
MRRLVALVFVTAFIATFVAQVASRSTPPRAAQAAAAAPDAGKADAGRIAELKAGGSAEFNSGDGSIALDRAADGHFYADVRINGNPVHMLIDTGASSIALSRDDARAAGLATSIGMNDDVGEGADGAVHGEYVKLDRVELGPLSASGLDAVVLNSGQQSLLGQSFLAKFSSVQIEGDRMVLR